jgi:3-methyl-2-oxobutanoate hydroxymethyltransferase
MKRAKITVRDIVRKKLNNQKITVLTAYDYPMAVMVDQSDVDIVLVGDSLANVVLGLDSTVGITMDQMIHHSCAVRRGVKRALLVGDMPFMSYHVSPKNTIQNAGRFLKEAGVDAVKIEGANAQVIRMVKALRKSDIQVMGHVGLTPQTAGSLGGFKVQGRDSKAANQIIKDALALEKAGCFSIVLECIPEQLSAIITRRLSIPTIGIGAGKYCDGQVLVINDLLGLNQGFTPKFVKKYADLSKTIKKALAQFVAEVNESKYPSRKYSYNMDKDQLKGLE